MEAAVIRRQARLMLAAGGVFILAAGVGWWLMQSSVPSSQAAGIQDAELSELAATERDIKVFKTATCGCCSAWVEHLEAEGFSVEAVDVSQSDLNGIKQAAEMGRELASCHTAFIDGYVLEGHVPAEDIRRLAAERPSVTGIAVPGMPVGSPGMEVGDRYDPYDVVAFRTDGSQEVFSSHNQD